MRLTRRRLLQGSAAGVALSAARLAVAQPLAPAQSLHPGTLTTGTFVSAARRGTPTGWALVLPTGIDPAHPRTTGGAPLPVCVVLHGHGGDASDLQGLGYDRALNTAVAAGLPPFALAAVGGGDRYWHARRAGDDSGRMVVEEFLPLLASRGLAAGPADAIALMGWSMGGYGALLLASRLGPARVAGVVAISPALWRHPAEADRGAFDDEADFRAHDVFGRRAELSRLRLRIDCGTADRFAAATAQLAAGLRPRAAGGLRPGDHSRAFWRRLAGVDVGFAGRALAARGGLLP